jgi:hypothetical protein
VRYALPVWTLLIWATRIRIIFSQHQSKTAVILPVVMTVLAVGALVDRRWLIALVVVTVGVWVVRLPFVLVHQHTAAFKLVHAVLALVSLALAAATVRTSRLAAPTG